MKKFLVLLCCAVGMLCLSACQNEAEVQQVKPQKVLTVYYSYTHKTEEVAKAVAESTGGDLFALEVVNPYPKAQKQRERRIKKESAGKLPAIKAVPALESYDVILVGYPIWYSKLPPVVTAFLKQARLEGKKIAFFCTSGSSPISVTLDDLKNLVPQSTTWIGAKRLTSAQEAREWIANLKLKP